jgi:hypothetical protein
MLFALYGMKKLVTRYVAALPRMDTFHMSRFGQYRGTITHIPTTIESQSIPRAHKMKVLLDEVESAVGMKVLVTYNIETDTS